MHIDIPDYLADAVHRSNQGKRDSWLVELDSIIDQARRCFPPDNHVNPDASADYGATTTDYDLPADDPTTTCPRCIYDSTGPYGPDHNCGIG